MRVDELAVMRADELTIDRYTRNAFPTFRDIVAVLFRQRWPMVIAFVLVVIAVASSGVWIPKYEAQMKILALRQRSDAMVTPSANPPEQFNNDEVSQEDLNSEVELLNSDDLLRKVVLATGLAVPSGSSDRGGSEVRVAEAVRKLGKDLKIEPVTKTNVISVRYQARDPETAAKVLKALAAAYVEKHLEVHHPVDEFKFFDQQMEQYKQGLNEAQAKLTAFTKGTGVVSASLERDSALRQADDFDSAARQAQTALLETKQRIHALQVELRSIRPRITTVERDSDNPQLLEQLKSTLLNLELKRTDLLTKYEPTYPLVEAVDRQVADTKSAISAEESKPVRDATTDQNPDYQWVLAELTKAQADLSGLKTRASVAATIAAKYHEEAQRLGQSDIIQDNLLQTAKTAEADYLLYEQKREEARISDALDQRGILNVSLAEQPVVPALPKRSPLTIAILALLLAGTFSLSTAFVLDFLDPTFRTPDELAVYLGTPVLAALPKGGGVV
jgi:uncharacterized protein involved in exopolysaccharide biosynthesis